MIPVEYVGETLPDEVFQILAEEPVQNPNDIARGVRPKYWAKRGVDTSDKWTEGCQNCLAVVGLGESNYSPVSFLAHINPVAFLDKPDNFYVKYPYLLAELPNPTDILIAGGYKNPNTQKGSGSFMYNLAVSRLNEIHRNVIGMETLVLPPKDFKGITNVFVTDGKIYVQQLDENSPFVIALRASKIKFPRIW